jgi:hypothetical protein
MPGNDKGPIINWREVAQPVIVWVAIGAVGGMGWLLWQEPRQIDENMRALDNLTRLAEDFDARVDALEAEVRELMLRR